ncbi:M4 family metallopeptidase [Seonamhaeicola maritimus]|uniref:M4 family metallopeptidase n=1 Tax=Seonamhaeicola maritimus TaxID=2591822 RepID=UPI002494D9FF|nr:M4 family metallopeptidase [Seonamhaeicola maritimus]
MKNKIYYLLPLVFIALFSSVIGAQNVIDESSQGFKKIMKFDNRINLEEAKKQFLNEFGLGDDNTFLEIKQNIDKKGVLHQKFQQYYKGFKVEYGTLIIHSKNGNVSMINGELYKTNGLDLEFSMSSLQAFDEALSYVEAQRYMWEEKEASEIVDYKKPQGEKIIYPLIENNSYTLKLAYKYDIYATIPVSRGEVYIDAKNGDFLFNNPVIKHYNNNEINFNETKSYASKKFKENSFSYFVSGSADTRYSGNRIIETRAEGDGTFTLNDDIRNIHTYNAQNSFDPQVYLNTTVDFIDDDNNWTNVEYDNASRDNAALDVHWGTMKVYDFWASLGRNSYNDMGAPIRSYVHVGTNYFNAFWNGSVMSYGDGTSDPLTAIDVVAHEIAHGVTTWTADLVYARESGAMNEAFSDIFAAAVEHYAKGTGTDTNPDPNIWALIANPGFTLRSLITPNTFNDPETYNGLYYTDATSSCIPSQGNDYCGVHSNSGVLNHWFYILVAGESGTNEAGDTYNVTGVGMTKAQEIAYLILRDYLTPNSTFIDARNAGIEVASSLYGSNSAERQATQDAFFAVNIGDEFVPFPTDLNLFEFSQLVDITCGDDVIPKIKVRNSGANNVINTIQINYFIDGVLQTPVIWNGTLAVDAETEITLPAISESTVKSFDLVVDSVVTGDGDSSNNSLTGAFRVNRDDNTPTEVNTFENFLVDYWLTYNEGGGSNLWIIGAPNKTSLNSVTSGLNAYTMGTTANYPDETKSFLISPCYDLTSLSNPIMKFNMAFQMEENFDILYVEYSTDLINWTILGSATDPNWYNSDRIFESGELSSDCQNCPGAQWTGIENTFKEYSYDLSSFTAESNINFRFVFQSDASGTDEGVVIDDFVIENTLSVDEFELNNSVSIYPNPSSNLFNISFNKNYENIEIGVFDIRGNHLINRNHSGETNHIKLNMNNYAAGIYFLKITRGSFTITKKVIIK